MNQQLIEQYKALRNKVDKESNRLTSMHKSQLACKKGCDLCCESLKIFPIEFETIQKELEGKHIPVKKWTHNFGNKCRFLVNSVCTIYESRPIICRTQGLPLLYEKQDGTGYELSVCQLNFKGVDVNVFSMENALFMPSINSKLFLINQEFVQNHPKVRSPQARVRLNSL